MASYKQLEQQAEAAYEASLRNGEPYKKRLPKFINHLATRRIHLNGGSELRAIWTSCTMLAWTVWAFAKVLAGYLIGLPIMMVILLLSPISMFLIDTIRVHEWEREDEDDEWAQQALDEQQAMIESDPHANGHRARRPPPVIDVDDYYFEDDDRKNP